MKLYDIISAIESLSPVVFQESYDNAGLQIGNIADDIHAALLTIDVTEDVVHEAVQKKADLIIAHHPLIFSGLKRITGETYIERTVSMLVKNNIALYIAHTNLDNVAKGVNVKICEKLGLERCRILSPAEGELCKLVTFVPVEHARKVRMAIFTAGAGAIGEYDQCSYNLEGYGTFRASDSANPFAGEKGTLHTEKETRIETIFPKYLKNSLIRTLIEAHPYEEPAYDIYPLKNDYERAGAGMFGYTPQPVGTVDFIDHIKKTFGCSVVRHSDLTQKKINKVAVCGGSGAFLIPKAIEAGADIFVTGEIKYHQFFESEGKIILADIGHFESEQFTKEIFYELLIKNFPNFALHFSEINTNPIKYY